MDDREQLQRLLAIEVLRDPKTGEIISRKPSPPPPRMEWRGGWTWRDLTPAEREKELTRRRKAMAG